MGLFLQTLILPDCTLRAAQDALKKAESLHDLELQAEKCLYASVNNGHVVLLNDSCTGYETLAQALSADLQGPVLLLYIFDEDFWGYYFYDAGQELDVFSPLPDYFEEVSDSERQRSAGNSTLIARYFQVAEETIANYLVLWEDAVFSAAAKAYPDDEYEQGYCWQMADFMRRLGYPYPW